jgi:hypothetical protein
VVWRLEGCDSCRLAAEAWRLLLGAPWGLLLLLLPAACRGCEYCMLLLYGCICNPQRAPCLLLLLLGLLLLLLLLLGLLLVVVLVEQKPRACTPLEWGREPVLLLLPALLPPLACASAFACAATCRCDTCICLRITS